MGKRLIYLFSICITMGLVLALWATDGFRSFATLNSKPFMPFAWGIMIFTAALGPILFANRLVVAMEDRSGLEIWGRGSVCGLMVIGVWSCIYFTDVLLKEFQLKYEIYLAAIGLVAALGLGVIGLLSDAFLRENLVVIGWLTAAAGLVVVHHTTHAVLGKLIAATGVSIVLTVVLITGRFRVYLRGRGSVEVLREESPGSFWIFVLVLAGVIAYILFNAICGAFGVQLWPAG